MSGLQDATGLLVFSRSTLVGLWFNTAAPFPLAHWYTLCLHRHLKVAIADPPRLGHTGIGTNFYPGDNMNVQQLHASTQVLQPFFRKPELSGYTFNFKHPLVVNLCIQNFLHPQTIPLCLPWPSICLILSVYIIVEHLIPLVSSPNHPDLPFLITCLTDFNPSTSVSSAFFFLHSFFHKWMWLFLNMNKTSVTLSVQCSLSFA